MMPLACTIGRVGSSAQQPTGFRGEIFLKGVEIAQYHLEEVVEVVSDASCELTDRFHLLSLAKRLLLTL